MQNGSDFGPAVRRHLIFWALLAVTSGISTATGQMTPPIGIAPSPSSESGVLQSASDPAEAVPGIPAFNSRPGAAYTVYLDFGGFSFTGKWGNNALYTPGVTPAYDVDGNATAFNTTEVANIKNVWSRTAEKYAGFNVNVTTVDPAVAAGQAGTDLARQNYYDGQPKVMHTVVGGPGSWVGGGGISYVGVTANTQSGSNGYHTNWVFSALASSNLQYIAEASAHENGHGLSLWHQDDYSGSSLINEYSSGNASVAPIMGNSYSTTRGLWAVGTSHVSTNAATLYTQNDTQMIANDPGMGGFIEDGIGHTQATATPIPVSGNTINATLAKGTIVPNGAITPTPLGTSNYTPDWWSFTTSGGLVTLRAISGRSTITAGVPDPGATLDDMLDIYDASSLLVSHISTSSLSEIYSATLPAGTYFAQISSVANSFDNNPSFTPRSFFDMGDYFLAGTIPIPEPTAPVAAILTGTLLAGHRCRRA